MIWLAKSWALCFEFSALYGSGNDYEQKYAMCVYVTKILVAPPSSTEVYIWCITCLFFYVDLFWKPLGWLIDVFNNNIFGHVFSWAKLEAEFNQHWNISSVEKQNPSRR